MTTLLARPTAVCNVVGTDTTIGPITTTTTGTGTGTNIISTTLGRH